MTRRVLDLTGQRFGKLVVMHRLEKYPKGRVIWHCQCDCGNTIDVPSRNLMQGWTSSCGCAKKEKDQVNLREKYDDKRVEGVVKPLFKGQKPRKDSSTGYRGVNRYYTRKSREVRYRAWITVAGKKHYKGGFLTPKDAYYHGRIELEKKYLPFDPNEKPPKD